MFKESSKGIYLFVKIIPNASKNVIVGMENDRLKIRLVAVPEKGLANDELIKFLSSLLEIPKKQIWITTGKTSRLKTLLIQGISLEKIQKIF